MVLEFLNINNFPSFYLVLIGFAPESMICQAVSSQIHSLPMLSFPLNLNLHSKKAI